MHQIGNTFTRLLPVIEFTNCALTLPPDTVCVLDEPPASLAEVHSPSLLNAWYNKLQHCLAQPVQVEQRQGQRRVHLLGAAIFDFAADGLLQVYVWDFDENDRIRLTELPTHAVVVQGAPFGVALMNRFKLGVTRALLQRHPGAGDLCGAYVDWAHDQLLARCWDQTTQDRVRYQIAVELDVDLCMSEFSNQVRLSELPRRPLRADFYNQAVRFAQNRQKLQQEAPQLLPMFVLLAEVLDAKYLNTKVEPTAQMQRWLRAQRIAPATWRLLCHAGTAWMNEFLPYFNVERQTSAATVLDLVRLAQAFGTHQLVAPWLLHALIQVGGNPNSPGSQIADLLDDLFPLCTRLGHLVAQADEATLARLRDRAHELFNWASDHWAAQSSSYARRCTVRGLLRKVEAQLLRESVALKGSEPWPVSYQLQLEDAQVQAVILDSPLAVWTEGRDMRHCADNYIDKCARGDWLMVSLRRVGDRHALATVAFNVRADQVTQAQISGFANTLVSPQVQQLARECQGQLHRQRNQLAQSVAVTAE